MLVRGGVTNPSDRPQSDLQKAGYLLEGGDLKRVTWPQLDGAAPGAPATILSGLSAATTRFRGLNGNWSSAWVPATPDALPRAVEVTLEPTGRAPVRLVFALSGDPAPPPPATPAEESDSRGLVL